MYKASLCTSYMVSRMPKTHTLPIYAIHAVPDLAATYWQPCMSSSTALTERSTGMALHFILPATG